MDRLACTPAAESDPRYRAEKIANPVKFDGTRERLKAFRDQLLLKASDGPTTQVVLCLPVTVAV